MSKPLKILYVVSEVAPLVKTGGLADVAYALPKALREQGHDVRIALPLYATIPDEYRGRSRYTCFVNLSGPTQFGALRESVLPDTDVPVYLIEHNGFFHREHPYGYNGAEYEDNLERFCFFCMAVLDGAAQLGWKPDVVHCNDWHTAPLPAYLHTRFRQHPFWANTPVVFTIHNLRYQGLFPPALLPKTGFGPELFNPDCLEFYGRINLMKAGIAFATKINTVSRTYAREIQTPDYGHGLDGFLRTRKRDLTGILNGIDVARWNPARDPYLPIPYSLESLEGKTQCKRALLEQFGLPRNGAPLFSMVSRLVWEKGLDLVLAALESILKEGVQMIILGTGEPRIEAALERIAARYPHQLAVVLDHRESLAHLLYAGADFFLMPSYTEACGLSQMYSLVYGTVPIVRKTGGLADTVVDATPVNLSKGIATGLVFRPPTVPALRRAVLRAIRIYRESCVLRALQQAGMEQDFSWRRASKEYVELYQKACGTPRARGKAVQDKASVTGL